MDSSTILDNSKQDVNARIGFQTHLRMYKYQDFRCLKPKLNVDSENWPHYDMTGYRAAKSKQELENIKEIKFDKNFFNFEDPKVFRAMTDSRKGIQLWKKTYGFDYATFVEGFEAIQNNTKCSLQCLKAEQSFFASKCQKIGGIFKCCLLSYVFTTCNPPFPSSNVPLSQVALHALPLEPQSSHVIVSP